MGVVGRDRGRSVVITKYSFQIPRRRFLQAAAAIAAVNIVPAKAWAQGGNDERQLVVKPGRAALRGEGYPETAVWTYDGVVPGPLLRIRQGEPFRVVVENKLEEDTTVHWHGIRLPNAMDGVPGLTQPPIRPGESFVYEFTPPDAGTFWYHPHSNSLEQLGRGLAGVLIVDETEPVPVDRDRLWTLRDWRVTSKGQVASGFGNMMEAGMSGRLGNTVTLNGAVPGSQRVRAGERVRLRLVNVSLARIMRLRFEGHDPLVIAVDGQPCQPHTPDDGHILLGPAMRIDLMIDMTGSPGRRYPVIDDFYEGLEYRLTELAYASEAPVRTVFPKPFVLPANPLPEPDLSAAERHELVLEGGMMGRGMMQGMGGMRGMAQAIWSINGTSMAGDGHAGTAPLLTLGRGKTHLITMRNQTAWWHPMHLHGFSFRVLTRNGAAVPHRRWADTVLMAPEDTIEIAFVADAPGDWMLHCHVTDHQMTGLMTVLRVADAEDRR
jgi:FtsP/CotA-like multicopper oxidase with cupredoxin domain